MNYSINSILVVAIISASFASAHDDFENYVRVFNKTYATAVEATLRREIYLQNKQFIERFNAEQAELVGFRMGENHLTDLSREEIAIRRGSRIPADYFKPEEIDESGEIFANLLANVTADIPDELDWTKVEGRVSPVQDQGQCGSDWAFSASGALEGQLKKSERQAMPWNLVPLSAQNLVDCSKSNWGCDEGYAYFAYKDIKAQGGIQDSLSYPYSGQDGQGCKFDKSKAVTTLSGFHIYGLGNEEVLKKIVATVGPISTSIDASQATFQHYSGGVYYEPKCRSLLFQLDLAVLIVGYGKDPATGQDFWLIKNSWGEKWGEKGFMRLARNRNNSCGVATMPLAPFI